jgi:hypothetical protein
MKKFLEWLHKVASDSHGLPSSKRVVGILSSLALIFVLIYSSINESHDVNDTIVNAVALLAFGCLGLSSVDKFTIMKKDIAKATSTEKEIE